MRFLSLWMTFFAVGMCLIILGWGGGWLILRFYSWLKDRLAERGLNRTAIDVGAFLTVMTLFITGFLALARS